jgi:hypothetical protein
MKILSYNPVVWTFAFVLTFTAYFARINPALGFPFKLAYNITSFTMMYGLLFLRIGELKTRGLTGRHSVKKRSCLKND